MEILGPLPGYLQEPLDGKRFDLTDVGRGFDGTAVHQALDDAHHGDLGELGALQEGALVFAETLPAVSTVQPANIVVLTNPTTELRLPAAKRLNSAQSGLGQA